MDKDTQRHLDVKYLRFYLESTYKQKFKVKHVTPTYLLIEWVGLPHTDEIRQCVTDGGMLEGLDKLQLVQHWPDYPDKEKEKEKKVIHFNVYPHQEKLLKAVREGKKIVMRPHRKERRKPFKYLSTRGITILIDGCRHVLIGAVVFTLRTWMIDK